MERRASFLQLGALATNASEKTQAVLWLMMAVAIKHGSWGIS